MRHSSSAQYCQFRTSPQNAAAAMFLGTNLVATARTAKGRVNLRPTTTVACLVVGVQLAQNEINVSPVQCIQTRAGATGERATWMSPLSPATTKESTAESACGPLLLKETKGRMNEAPKAQRICRVPQWSQQAKASATPKCNHGRSSCGCGI